MLKYIKSDNVTLCETIELSIDNYCGLLSMNYQCVFFLLDI